METQTWLHILIALVGLLCTVVGLYIARTLKGIDENQVAVAGMLRDVFARLHMIEKDFYELHGEHKINHK